MTAIRLDIPEQVLHKTLEGIKIPSPPQLVLDLQKKIQSPNVKIDEIANIVIKDVGIAGNVLKMVNSPFFSLRSNIVSIKHAINLLGVQNIFNIVNSIAIRQSFSSHNLIDMTRFWDNATDVAVSSTYISRLLGIASPDEAYALGLFHNSGIPLLLHKFPNYSDLLKLAYSEHNYRITDIENFNIKCNHSVAGYYVAKSWKLPLSICEAIADHHKTQPIFSNESPSESHKKNLLAILKLAENICGTHKSFGREFIDYEFEVIKEDLFAYLGISPYEFEELKEEVLEEITN